MAPGPQIRLLPLALLLACGDDGLSSPAGVCAPTALDAQNPAQPPSSSKVVAVFWDVSGTMSKARTRTYDVVEALDSKALQAAGATGIRHFAVGTNVRAVPDARAALEATGEYTSLHEAAMLGGDALRGEAGAAVFVSDMALEMPPNSSPDLQQRCPDIPLPTPPTPRQVKSGRGSQAGATFGRYLQCGLAGQGGAERRELVAATYVVPPVRAEDRAVHLLVIATNPEFGRSIGAEILRAWPEAAPTVLLDTSDNRLGDMSCRWEEGRFDEIGPAGLGGIGPAEVVAGAEGQCNFTCQRADVALPLVCSVPGGGASQALFKPGAIELSVQVSTAESAGAWVGGSERAALGATTVEPNAPFVLELRCGGFVTDGSSGQIAVRLQAERGWSDPVLGATVLSTDPNVSELYRGVMTALAALHPQRSHSWQVDLLDD